MAKLSVVIITKNEAHNIERCINSCLPLQAEIIVLDSHSTDNTVQIVKRLGAQVHLIDWNGYGATKNHGAKLATHDWILSLDADEALDENLQKNILETLHSEDNFYGYWLRRALIFNGQQLTHGAVKNEKRLRLFNKKFLQWNLNEVHEDLEKINENQAVFYGQLEGKILHYSYKNELDMEKRLDKYAKLSAQKLSSKSTVYLKLKKYFAPKFSFIQNYYFKKGYQDGTNGRLFAKAQARYVRKKYSYALETK